MGTGDSRSGEAPSGVDASDFPGNADCADSTDGAALSSATPGLAGGASESEAGASTVAGLACSVDLEVSLWSVDAGTGGAVAGSAALASGVGGETAGTGLGAGLGGESAGTALASGRGGEAAATA